MDPERFARRRTRLMERHPGCLFLLPGPSAGPAPAKPACARQERNLLYLTGLEQTDVVLVLHCSAQRQGFRSLLFVAERDPNRELVEGPALGPAEAAKSTGVDEALPLDALSGKLTELLHDAELLGYRLGVNRRLDDLVVDSLEQERQRKPGPAHGLLPIHDPGVSIGELRLYKDAQELRQLRRAAQISAAAHRAAMAAVRAGMSELALAALLEERLKAQSSRRTAYPTIVASGPRASVLHAKPTERTLRPGELVLVDAAGEYRGYASDLTRSFPVDPRFSRAQAQIYSLVLDAQQAGIERVRPGGSLPQVHDAVVETLRAGLVELGVDAADEALFEQLFPHRTSHWLGLDVHDVGLRESSGEPRRLEPNMLFTVEPGLYFPLGDERLPAAYRGLGVRVEDTVLVTERGAEVLTADAPKQIADIERLRGAS